MASDNTQFRVTCIVESTRVSLTVRKTGPASLAYQQWADYTVYDHGRAIGRIYEDRATRPGLRWFWSITMIGARHTGIRTDGCTPTLKQAKAELQANWRKWLVSARLEGPTVPNDHQPPNEFAPSASRYLKWANWLKRKKPRSVRNQG